MATIQSTHFWDWQILHFVLLLAKCIMNDQGKGVHTPDSDVNTWLFKSKMSNNRILTEPVEWYYIHASVLIFCLCVHFITSICNSCIAVIFTNFKTPLTFLLASCISVYYLYCYILLLLAIKNHFFIIVNLWDFKW